MATDAVFQLVAALKIAEPTFHPFPRLPIELRIEIWEELIPEIHNRLLFARGPGLIQPLKHKFLSILQSISHESRRVFLSRFPVGLQVTVEGRFVHTDENTCKLNWREVGLVYINPIHDILVVGQPCRHELLGHARNLHFYSEGSMPSLKLTEPVYLFAQPLRRQQHRDSIQNIMALPVPPLFDYIEYEIWESDWPGPYKWPFRGVKKLVTLTEPLVEEKEVVEFYQDAEELTGSEMLKKWHSKFTVTVSEGQHFELY